MDLKGSWTNTMMVNFICLVVFSDCNESIGFRFSSENESTMWLKIITNFMVVLSVYLSVLILVIGILGLWVRYWKKPAEEKETVRQL